MVCWVIWFFEEKDFCKYKNYGFVIGLNYCIVLYKLFYGKIKVFEM